jgi:hypothetical protein
MSPVWYLLTASAGSLAIGVVRVVCLWLKLKFSEHVVQQAREQGVTIELTEILKMVLSGRHVDHD